MNTLEDVFNAASLCNFADKKVGNPTIVGQDTIKYIRSNFKTAPCPWQCARAGNRDWDSDKLSLQCFITEIIQLFPNNLVLAGGAIRSIILDYEVNDYDLFFYNTTPAEAENIIITCAKYLENKYPAANIKYERSLYTTNFVLTTAKIQFIHRIYKTRGQILLGFDLAGSRLGWAADCGIFATIDGAVALACDGFLVDTTQLSTTFGYRLVKYCYDKMYDIYFPNMRAFERGEKICTPDLRITKHSKHNNLVIGSKSNNDTTAKNYEEQGDRRWSNWWYIANNISEYVIFASYNIVNVVNIDDNVAERSIACGAFWKHISAGNCPLNIKTAIAFFGDKFSDYVSAIRNRDHKTTKKLLESMQEYYINAGKIAATKVNSLDKWRIENPGSQSFGKYNPIIADPREWFGAENYVPYKVGLDDLRVETVRLICVRLGVPSEICETIIKFWLIFEADDAQKMLTGL